MRSDLQIYTSFISVKNLKRCTIDLNYVPIFAMKKIYNSEIIGIYSGTAIHFPDLSPSNELYHAFIDGEVDIDSYRKLYRMELEQNVDLADTIKRLELISKISEASGVAIMTFGRDPRTSYRPELISYFNDSGLLIKPVYEI